MDFFEVIFQRRSIRKFLEEPVKDEDWKKMIEAARLAPSAHNYQPWHFIVVKNRDVIKKMASIIHQKIDQIKTHPELQEKKDRIEHYRYFFTFFENAPLVIAVLGKQEKYIVQETMRVYDAMLASHIQSDSNEQSVAAAVENLLLAATALGYGGCWMTGPLIALRELEEILKVEPPWYLTAIVPIGRPLKVPRARPRKSLEEIVTVIE